MRDPIIESLSESLEWQIEELFLEHHLIGLSVGIVRDQELVWKRGFGYADLASERRPDENTLYRVASITKTFTGAAIFQLRDEGRQMPPVRLEPTDDPDAFLATSGRSAGEQVHFRRDKDGKITGYITTGFPWWKLARAGQ